MDRDNQLDRLLRSARAHAQESPSEVAPFGFETRVVALARARRPDHGLALPGFVRRVVLLALAVIVISTAAAYRELAENETFGEPDTNEFAIADAAIQDTFL